VISILGLSTRPHAAHADSMIPFQPSRIVAEAGLGAGTMRAQHWSLASQHGLCRLVPKVAPHHSPVQQPKAFCCHRKMTEADQLRGPKSKLESAHASLHVSPGGRHTSKTLFVPLSAVGPSSRVSLHSPTC
jgi:hypothetical protein